MKKKIFIILILLILAAGGGVLAVKQRARPVPPSPENAYVPDKPDLIKPDYVLLNVPFTSQAPTGNWSDPRQEDGCEEAAVLMAWSWINNSKLVPAESEQTIIAMANFELEHYGSYQDFDAADTARFMTDYYGYKKLTVSYNPTIEEIKLALSQGKVVLVPTNGQKLGNPNYKQPGPLTHMLVIKGYNDAAGQFITNDPGTRNGEGYVYKYQVLYDAMVDYPSGSHESQVGRPKSMIVVER